MPINPEQFEADLEKLLRKYGISAMLVLVHYERDLSVFVAGVKPEFEGMKVLKEHIWDMLDDVQEKVREAIRNAADDL
jgi:hypothetical protein